MVLKKHLIRSTCWRLTLRIDVLFVAHAVHDRIIPTFLFHLGIYILGIKKKVIQAVHVY